MSTILDENIEIRAAKTSDWPGVLALYNYFVRSSPCTFDTEEQTIDTRQSWFASFGANSCHHLLLAMSGPSLLGYAASSQFKPKPAYATSVETSVYCQPAHTGRGIGKRLYAALMEHLVASQVHRAYAFVTLPNEPSDNLHGKFGFQRLGIMSEAGHKLGRFWDVALWERRF